VYAQPHGGDGLMLGRTLAHELLHGAYALEHTFAAYPELTPGSTDNVMDYGSGFHLHKYQWDLIHNPERHLGWFDEDEEGESGAPEIEINEVTQYSRVLIDIYTGEIIAWTADNTEAIEVYWTYKYSLDVPFDSNNPWDRARALRYNVGRESGGISGLSFRPNHPLYMKGTRFGEIVYLEDLLDMSDEFSNLIRSSLGEFAVLAEYSGYIRNREFHKMVDDDAKYDLKSRNVDDGTPSYAAVVIGEWSIFKNRLRRYDDYGNIMYGYCGKEAGFSDSWLLVGSEVNQIMKDLDPWSETSGVGDEARDKIMIEMGIVNWRQRRFH